MMTRRGNVAIFCIVAVTLPQLVLTMCPQECVCISEEQKVTHCDNTALADIPALLDPRITSLTMVNCTLKRLDPDVLELYPDLEYLDLSFNEIDVLDVKIFKYQTKLRVLRLRGNQLSSIQPDSFVGLSQLQMLDLSANRLTQLDPFSFPELSHLRELTVSSNLLTTLLPDTFAGLKNLQQLDLSNNRLHTIARHLFHDVSTLRLLDLSHNNLSKIEADTFVNLTSLKHLDLSSNSLADLSFNGLNSLRYLNISCNSVRQISASSYRSLSLLRELDLSSNQVLELATSSLDGLNSLEVLRMTNEPYLHSIKLNAFSGLRNLRKLNLSSCHLLEEIDENAFEYGDQLEVLDLSNCRLERLPEKLVEWNNLKSLRISGNPLHCDCEMLSFLPEILRKFSINATCFTPPWLFDRDIMQLSGNCATLNGSQLVFAILGASLLILTILLTLGLCSRRGYLPLCNKYSSGGSCRAQNKCRSHLYSKPFLIASPINDKSELLSEHTCYTTTNGSTSNGFSRSGGLYDDEGYYSSVMLPAECNAYERARPVYPTPPPAATIPQTLPKSYGEDNFRIISHHPVPITEL
ncbi:unnamed protein product [Litomosoides sigmodontis]|uniref:LRRCT domain-containing protein n=1 Tax=Litomosoides sigmodontis TaxID=42156 RepID=A0A3P6U406_LITSI|nr:unnamed protein product [Litomosoides sigmodontis]